MFPRTSPPPAPSTPLRARIRVAAALARCPVAAVYRFDGSDAILAEAHGSEIWIAALPARAPAWRLRRGAIARVPVIGRGPAAPESALFGALVDPRALISAPLVREGEQVGALLMAGTDTGDDVACADLPALEAICALLLEALLDERSAVRATDTLPPELSERAAWPLSEEGHDPVTGLPNRSMIEDTARVALEEAARHDLRVGVASVALDRLQRIDDWLGRAVSDELMRQVAERLLETTGERDLVGRTEEGFVVVFTDLAPNRSPLALAHRMQQSFRDPFHVQGYELSVSATIGVSRYPEDADDVTALMRYSGIALRRARARRRRGSVECFTSELREAVERRGDLERDLRHALSAGELLLHYQPKVDLRTRRAHGVEALIRWQRAGKLISPGHFLPVAEESELIVPIGSWVMLEACRQMKRWQSQGVPLASVSVNVSALQFARPDFVTSVERVLKHSTLPPECLELEVTETSLMDDVAAAAEKLAVLRRVGVRVSVDDFGTGYSSLSYLQRLPVDVLKIDRSFVKDLDGEGTAKSHAHALTEAITGLGHSLGLEVLAEGVETEAQLDALDGLGCDAVQGYYFSRPVPAADIGRVIS